jgi:hypothetical protein
MYISSRTLPPGLAIEINQIMQVPQQLLIEHDHIVLPRFLEVVHDRGMSFMRPLSACVDHFLGLGLGRFGAWLCQRTVTAVFGNCS